MLNTLQLLKHIFVKFIVRHHVIAIEKELDVLVNEWNHHYIRKSKYCETIGGIPEILYFLPEQYGECYMFQS